MIYLLLTCGRSESFKFINMKFIIYLNSIISMDYGNDVRSFQRSIYMSYLWAMSGASDQANTWGKYGAYMELDFDGDFDDMEAGYGACFEAGITRVLELIFDGGVDGTAAGYGTLFRSWHNACFGARLELTLIVVMIVRELVKGPYFEAGITRLLELVRSRF